MRRPLLSRVVLLAIVAALLGLYLRNGPLPALAAVREHVLKLPGATQVALLSTSASLVALSPWLRVDVRDAVMLPIEIIALAFLAGMLPVATPYLAAGWIANAGAGLLVSLRAHATRDEIVQDIWLLLPALAFPVVVAEPRWGIPLFTVVGMGILGWVLWSGIAFLLSERTARRHRQKRGRG